MLWSRCDDIHWLSVNISLNYYFSGNKLQDVQEILLHDWHCWHGSWNLHDEPLAGAVCWIVKNHSYLLLSSVSHSYHWHDNKCIKANKYNIQLLLKLLQQNKWYSNIVHCKLAWQSTLLSQFTKCIPDNESVRYKSLNKYKPSPYN